MESNYQEQNFQSHIINTWSWNYLPQVLKYQGVQIISSWIKEILLYINT